MRSFHALHDAIQAEAASARDRSGESQFRADINGLRAWAVVSVIFYHFGVPGFGAGFAGVDVFFVISGYLMTSIVVSELVTTGRFAVADFYMARARRIVPALGVLCLGLLVVGWRFLLPLEYKMLATHAFFSLTFLSNFKFWLEAGYFDADSHEKWLLHTWSLAVEWQFYLLLPLGLMLLWKLRPGRRAIVVGLVVSALVSLGMSVALGAERPASSFYLLHTRAWEMFAGGLVYMLTPASTMSSGRRRMLEVIGFTLILGTVTSFDTEHVWPGWRALVPVTGTVLVLVAARVGSAWTGAAPAQWLGTRSYSLYLWHWPLFVALVYTGRETDLMALAICLALTLVAGHLSYEFIESPSRARLRQLGKSHRIAALAGISVAVVLPAAAIRLADGAPNRVEAAVQRVSEESLNRHPRQVPCHISSAGSGSPSCVYGTGRLGAILVGDSHANTVASALTDAASVQLVSVMEWSRSNCPTLVGARSRRFAADACGDFLEWMLNELKGVPRDVAIVIVNRSAMYAKGAEEDKRQRNVPWVYFSSTYPNSDPAFLREYAQRLTASACLFARDHPVYLVRPIPEMPVNVPQRMARSLMSGTETEISISLSQYRARQDFIWAAQDAARSQCGVNILDPLPYLCADGWCRSAQNGRPLYYDASHLSEFGNRLLVPMFGGVFGAQPLSGNRGPQE